MRLPTTIAWISAFALGVLAARTAHAEAPEEPVDPQVHSLSNAHLAASVETSSGDGGAAIGVRAALSYDLLHGHGETYRPALGVGLMLGGTGRDVEMSTNGIWDVGGFLVASLRFHRVGVVVDRRVFASAGILRDFGPVTSQTGMRYSIGGNWFSAAAESHNTWLLVLPHQIEGYYQEQLGDKRYGVALGYGF